MDYEIYKAVFENVLKEIIKYTENESGSNINEILIYGYFCFDASLYRVKLPDKEKIEIRDKIYNYMKEDLIIENISDESIRERIIEYAKILSEYNDSDDGPYFMLGQKFLENVNEEKKLENIIAIGAQLHYAYDNICRIVVKNDSNLKENLDKKTINMENTSSGTKVTYKDKYYLHFAWKPFLIIFGVMIAIILIFAK
jgi:hypothetical protein